MIHERTIREHDRLNSKSMKPDLTTRMNGEMKQRGESTFRPAILQERLPMARGEKVHMVLSL